MLQSTGSQSDTTKRLNWTESILKSCNCTENSLQYVHPDGHEPLTLRRANSLGLRNEHRLENVVQLVLHKLGHLAAHRRAVALDLVQVQLELPAHHLRGLGVPTHASGLAKGSKRRLLNQRDF